MTVDLVTLLSACAASFGLGGFLVAAFLGELQRRDVARRMLGVRQRYYVPRTHSPIDYSERL